MILNNPKDAINKTINKMDTYEFGHEGLKEYQDKSRKMEDDTYNIKLFNHEDLKEDHEKIRTMENDTYNIKLFIHERIVLFHK